MKKYWKIEDSKSNKLIVIKDQNLYKGNPKHDELQALNSEVSNLTFLKNLFCIPYAYIKKIENQKGKNQIKIYFGNDSEEELKVNNATLKTEIFEFLKQDNPNLKYSSELPSILKYAKGQFFALLFSTGIFSWTLYLAIQIQSGITYEIVGGQPGLTGIILGLANFGITKVVGGYLILLSIILFALFMRMKSRTETEFLKR